METLKRGPSMRGLEAAGGGAGVTPEALEKLFLAFSKSSREIERSHAELQARVEALTAELAEKDRRLEQKKRLEALGLVVAGVAHEFRNPLGSLSLYLDCLGDSLKPLPEDDRREAVELIGKIETGVRHLNGIVEDMLIFTRVSTPLTDRCDLVRLVDEALLLLRMDFDAAGVACGIEVDEALRCHPADAIVTGDRGQTVRILMNVLKNAVQAVAGFRPRGEGRVDVAVRTFPATAGSGPRGRRRRGLRREFPGAGPATVCVEVRDNGPGIPPERMEKLFVPFHTDKPRGVGLGLTIVHSLIERQGGRVEIENRAGGGLEVRLHFVAGGAEERTEKGREPPARGAAAGNGGDG